LLHFMHYLEIALPAPDVDLALHELNETLHDQILEQLLVLSGVSLLLGDHLDLGVVEELFNEAIDGPHLLNAGIVFGGTALDLELDLVLLEPDLVVVDDALLLLRDVLSPEFVELILAGLGDAALLVFAGAVNILEEGLVAALGF